MIAIAISFMTDRFQYGYSRKDAGLLNRSKPGQARAQRTYDGLLDAVGSTGRGQVERISTNLICERAGAAPPALNRYLDDRYALIGALVERLMKRQKAGFWLGPPAMPMPGSTSSPSARSSCCAFPLAIQGAHDAQSTQSAIIPRPADQPFCALFGK